MPRKKTARMIRSIESCFRADIRLSQGQSSECTEFSGSVALKGHMVPAGEFH